MQFNIVQRVHDKRRWQSQMIGFSSLFIDHERLSVQQNLLLYVLDGNIVKEARIEAYILDLMEYEFMMVF